MSLEISFNDAEKYTFDLGDIPAAQKTIKFYGIYCSSGQYNYLQECFGQLALLALKDPSKKITACKASHTLAYRVFSLYDDLYKKLFIANSVIDIFECSKLEMPKVLRLWVDTQASLLTIIQKLGFDHQAAYVAGLRLFPTNKPKLG